MKVQKITVNNLKAVSNQSATFEGCTAIVTGANNIGKSSFLRGIIDRVRGLKPEQFLKNGESAGFAECELTTGDKFRWDYKAKDGGTVTEKLTFITDKEIKTPATRSICDRYFPATFDVDEFLADTPQKQRKTLQKLAGLDFTDIDARYDTAFKERTVANTRVYDATVVYNRMAMPEKVESVDVAELVQQKEVVRASLNEQYLKNKSANETLRNTWQISVDTVRKSYQQACDTERESVRLHNQEATRARVIYNASNDALAILISHGYTGDAVDFVEKLSLRIGDEKQYEEPKDPVLPEEPVYVTELPDDTELRNIDQKIADATATNAKAALYQQWVELGRKKTDAADAAKIADDKVKSIEKERMDLIKTANMPEGFSFTDNGIAYNGFPFTREQLSSSGIYIAALKLASMTLGEVRTLHFDASFLDRKNLEEIEVWAAANDLQLLIERPSFEGGEISYEIIQN